MNQFSEKSHPFLVDVMSKKQKLQFWMLLVIWLVCLGIFWKWWLEPAHVASWLKMVVNSTILGWTPLLPGYYFFFVSRMKKSNPELVLPDNWRVAMVVTKAPSEPFGLVKETLQAMLEQKYPHDTWLADEDPTPQVVRWCEQNGVKISTRRGVAEYHRPTWPRRTKSKEGNLVYFYDLYGYGNYDFVAQLDADHRPSAGYLEEMLRPFMNPEVGYVSAPSICDVNASSSWAARARLYAEATLHGSLQAGYNAGWAPLCIGSHYAVRTKALEQIGGLGPELAEDHSTTFLMNARGWKGIHAMDAIAHGDGPVSFEDCMTQEYQWARSLVNLLLTLTPGHIMRMPWKLRGEFLFAQLWYPVFGLVMLFAYLIPILALFTKSVWVQLDYLQFVLFSTPLTVSSLAIVWWIQRQDWLRPANSPVLSWEVVLFQLTRWPWVLFASISSVIGTISGKPFNSKITPKGATNRPLPLGALVPYTLFTIISALTAILIPEAGQARGYYYFTIINSCFYTIVVLVIVFQHFKENNHVYRTE